MVLPLPTVPLHIDPVLILALAFRSRNQLEQNGGLAHGMTAVRPPELGQNGEWKQTCLPLPAISLHQATGGKGLKVTDLLS